MYKNIVTTVLLTLTLVLGGGLNPSYTAAQTVQDDTYTQTPGTTGQTNTADDNTGFDWRWLLPLLVVPFFFMFKRDTRDDNRTEYRNQGYAGSKGGRSYQERDEDLT